MKAKLLGVALMLTPFFALASELPYLFDFAGSPNTGKAYKSLISKQALPEWVKGGGTSTPAKEVVIKGVKYLVLSGCKPHNCPSQSIAVIYSSEKKDIHGVYSEYDFKNDRQKLIWLNLDPIESGVMRSILFAELSGDVEAHPENYNFK